MYIIYISRLVLTMEQYHFNIFNNCAFINVRINYVEFSK